MIRSAPCESHTDTRLGHALPGARPPCANHSSHELLGIDSSHSHTPSLVSHPMYSHGLEFGHGLVKASPDDVWAQVRRNGSEMVLIFACTPEFSPSFLFLPRTDYTSPFLHLCLSSSFLFTYFTFQLYARNVPVVLPFENLERERNRSLASILFTCNSTSFRCLAYQSFPFSRL